MVKLLHLGYSALNTAKSNFNRLLYLIFFFSFFQPINVNAQGKLCTYVRTTVTEVGYDYWCGDGFCIATVYACCDIGGAEIGCVPNPVEFATGGPGGGIDPRYWLQIRGLGPGGNTGWTSEFVYQLNDRGGSGCGNQGYTGTYNNSDFSRQINNVCVNNVEVFHRFWEEDACGSQVTYSSGCSAFYDDDYLLDWNTTHPISTFADGSTNYYLDRGIYEWWYTLSWNIANAPSVSSTTVYACYNQPTPISVTSSLDANGDFVLLSNLSDYNSIVSRIESTGTLTIPAVTSFPATFYVVEIDDNASSNANWCRGAHTTITVLESTIADPGFGDGYWNAVAYRGSSRNYASLPRLGYYTEPLLSYDSRNRWCANCSPADASGYIGCDPGVDNHTVVSKRTGFEPGSYTISIANHDDEARLIINGTVVFDNFGNTHCCDSHPNIWSGTLCPSSTVEFIHQEGGGGSHQGLSFTYSSPSTGFGLNYWNVLAYQGRDIYLGGGTTLYGSYTENLLTFDTRWRWPNTPAEATTTGSNGSNGNAYVGCDPGVDNHTVVSKRQGFPCGIYQLNTVFDDEWVLYVNGSIATAGSCCNGTWNGPHWTGYLSSTSTVEMRHGEGGGGTYHGVQFVNVTPTVNGGSIASDQTICVNGNPANIVSTSFASGGVSGYAGSMYYQWQYSLNGSTWFDISGATASSYNPGSISSTTYYRRRAQDLCGSTAYSNTVVVTVYPLPTAPTITRSPNDATVCVGASLNVVLNSGGSNGIDNDGSPCTVEYRYSTNNGASWSSWSTSTTAFTAVVGTNLYEARRDCSGNGCGSPSTQVSWTVVADPTTPTATKSPNVATVCEGQTLTLTSPSSSNGTGLCNFEYSYSTNGGSTYTAWSTAVPSFAATGSDNRIQVRRNCSGSGCNISGVATYTWNVAPDPTVSATGTTTICSGGSASLNSSASGGTGTCGLQWQISTAGSGGPFTNIGGATGSSYNTTSLTANTWYRVVSTCSGNNCNTATSNVVAITVAPDPIAGSITKSPNVNGVCEATNVSATFTTGSGGGGVVTDVYQFSTNGGSTWNTYVPGTNINTTGLNGNNIVQVRTRRESTGSNCTNSPWTTVFWTVDDAHTAATITLANPTVVCAGELVTLSCNANAGSNGSVDWYTGPGGTGTFIGSSQITTDNPTSSTTYYAWVHGSACPDVESSVSVTANGLNFVTLPGTGTYNNLVEQCVINGWTYYATAGSPDEWLFAIRKNVQSVVPVFDVDLASHSGVISSVYTGVNSHGSYLMRRYWNLELIAGSIANGIDIRFYYDPADMAAAVAVRDADYITYNGSSKGPTPQWFKTNAAGGGFHPSLLTPGMGNNWTFPFTFFGPGSSTGTENGVSYVQFDGLTSLSGGTGGTTFGESYPLLPVELVSLTANAKSNSIDVNWVTASEINNEKFEVLKSTDAITFEKIGTVAGQGTTNAVTNYSFSDVNVEEGVIYYYKLRQIDFDGQVDYSNVVSAVINKLGKFIIGDLVPNPTSNYSYVEIISPEKGDISFIITNIVGQEMMSGEFEMEEGSQRLYFDVNELLPGNYLITMVTNSGISIARKLQVIK